MFEDNPFSDISFLFSSKNPNDPDFLLLISDFSKETHPSSKNCTEVRAAHAARLFFLIQPIRSLFSDDVVAVAVVLA